MVSSLLYSFILLEVWDNIRITT